MTAEKTRELVRTYYESWKNGTKQFDAARLGAVLASRLAFESPMSRREDAASFVEALRRISTTVRELRFLQTLADGDECAVLYDADLESPRGTHRFAEFFRVEGERIAAIRLVFDPSEFRKLAK
jgi:ketosteroid isomerase-like protein